MISSLIGSASALVAQPPPTRADAWQFTYSVTPTADGRTLPAGRMVLDVAVWSGRVRITVREGALQALTTARGTILLRANDSSMAVVNPVKREVLTLAAGEFGALLTGPMGSAPIEVSAVTSVTRDGGAGGRVLGYATRNVTLTQGYALQLNTPGMQASIRTDQVIQLSLSRGIAGLDPGFRVFAEQFARSFALPAPVKRRLREMERAIPPGFPVRTLTTAVTVSGSDTVRSTTTAEMTALRRETIDTLSFVLPADFRVTEMSRLMPRQRRP